MRNRIANSLCHINDYKDEDAYYLEYSYDVFITCCSINTFIFLFFLHTKDKQTLLDILLTHVIQ